MSAQYDQFAQGAIDAWQDWRHGTLTRAMAGGSCHWWTGYRSLLRRPPADRAAFVRALYGGASGPGVSRRG